MTDQRSEARPGSPTIEQLIASLEGDAPIRQVVVGPRWSLVTLDTSPVRAGLASTLHSPGHGEDTVRGTGSPKRYPLKARLMAEMLRSTDILEASLGMAALNALLNVDESRCVEVNASEILIDKGTGRRVAIVGHFPFVDHLRAAAAQCWVLELRPGPGDVPAKHAAEILPRADVVGITGTALLNHTYDSLLALCRQDAFVIVLGGTAPLSPVLLDTGADAVAGTRLMDPAAAAQAVAQGASYREIPGKRLLTMMRPVDGTGHYQPNSENRREQNAHRSIR